MICAKCGQDHPVESMELTFARPDAVADLDADERLARVQENSDLSILDGQRFFVRAVFPIPVDSRDNPYNVGLWVELDRSSFERIYDLWEDPTQTAQPPFAGKLANDLPLTPGCLGLDIELRLCGPTVRPSAHLRPCASALYDEQRLGIDEHRIHEYRSLFT